MGMLEDFEAQKIVENEHNRLAKTIDDDARRRDSENERQAAIMRKQQLKDDAAAAKAAEARQRQINNDFIRQTQAENNRKIANIWWANRSNAEQQVYLRKVKEWRREYGRQAALQWEQQEPIDSLKANGAYDIGIKDTAAAEAVGVNVGKYSALETAMKLFVRGLIVFIAYPIVMAAIIYASLLSNGVVGGSFMPSGI